MIGSYLLSPQNTRLKDLTRTDIRDISCLSVAVATSKVLTIILSVVFLSSVVIPAVYGLRTAAGFVFSLSKTRPCCRRRWSVLK